MKSNYSKIIILIVLLIALNFVSSNFYHRIDLTKDNRYTLSETTHILLKNIQEPALIKIYLAGDFPS